MPGKNKTQPLPKKTTDGCFFCVTFAFYTLMFVMDLLFGKSVFFQESVSYQKKKNIGKGSSWASILIARVGWRRSIE